MGSGDTEVTGPAVHAPVTWAQRRHLILITINVEDCVNPELKVEPTKVHFRGTRGADKRLYEADLELYGEIDPETSKQQLSDRNIQLMLTRKEEGDYWPRLLKTSTKVHWLKVDFSKWRDEDESDDENGAGQDMNLEQMMQQMGGLGGGAGDGSKPSMDDVLSDSDDDDEDGPMPDLEQ